MRIPTHNEATVNINYRDHTHYSLGWMILMLGIDLLHHLQVLLALSFGSIVDAGSV